MGRVVVVFAGLAVGCACHHHKVVSFDVKPIAACPGDNVEVSWVVDGRARLAVVRGTDNPTPNQILAGEVDVPSKETRHVPVDQTTTFVIRAVQANQARDPWQGSRHVTVPTADQTKAVTTTCSGTTCTGTFTVHASANARVLKIASPARRQAGASTPAVVSVTHGSLQRVALEDGHVLDTSVPLDGEWTLETTLPEGMPTSPPPSLSVVMHVGCP